ncbi:Rrf2 family transcriptional regulator [Bianquea renquensis]|uniref:Rrf2 family transcriptional regulator n=1 Tax=Bianquea renquensis TaxID=2763661 RepID=A0A926DW22_9FIRM|nr:Rrf2 family transcriptional regulator [Bianquea renquensis]
MRISTKGRYALRLMLDLALYGNGTCISLRDISARQNVSVKYLEQIVVILARAGFVKSVRGPQGGYRLARPPKDYTAGEILRLIEGSLAPVPCLEDDTNSCPRSAECATVVLWSRLNQAISGVVDGMTLEDLAVIQRSKVDEAKDGM